MTTLLFIRHLLIDQESLIAESTAAFRTHDKDHSLDLDFHEVTKKHFMAYSLS